MRFRSDGWHFAEMKALGRTPDQLVEWGYGSEEIETFRNLEPAQPGDTWRVLWWKPEGEHKPIAGYAICCPQCKQVHSWTTALNCSPCPHEGKSSCWTWTGSAEENALTASPSLYASGACGWHGWLQNGVLRN